MDTHDFETVNLSKRVLSRLGVFFIDMKTGEGFADSRWSELGHSFDELKADELLARVHPDDREHVRQVLERHMRGEAPAFKAEVRLRDTNGTYRWFISSGIVERRDENGAPLTYVGHHEDVTNLHALREELQEARQVAEDRAAEAEALRGAGAVVVASLDAPTAVRSVIQQLHTLVPFDSAVVCELENRQLRYVGGSSDVTKETWKAFARRRLSYFLRVIKSRIPEMVDEPEGPTAHSLFIPLVARGSTVGVLAVSRGSGTFASEDVRVAMSMGDYLSLALSNARLYSRMQQRAEIDQLSGVLTRRAFMESAEQLIDESFRSQRPMCCIILDLDHFKSINDTFGHPVGDQVIRTLGAVMRDSLRSSDTIGRFGGEEFCALLTDTTFEGGLEVAERLRDSIAGTDFLSGRREVTASIGVTSVAHDGSAERLTIEQMLERADVALYNAKESGRNRVVEYNRGMTGEPVAGTSDKAAPPRSDATEP